MKSNVIKIIATSMAMLSVCSFAVNAAMKVAVVDMPYVFANSPQSVNMEKQIDKMFEPQEKQLKKAEENFSKRLNDFKVAAEKMSATDLKKNQQSLLKEKDQLQQQAQEFVNKKTEMQHSSVEKVMKQLNEVVQSVAKEKGYNMVIDHNAVLMSDKSDDLTSLVLSKVKQ